MKNDPAGSAQAERPRRSLRRFIGSERNFILSPEKIKKREILVETPINTILDRSYATASLYPYF